VAGGSRPEPRDAPIELELAATSGLAEALAALPHDAPAIGGVWSLLRPPGRDPGEPDALVRLEPPSGTRVSIGRFLELLKQAAPGGLELLRVRRRVAWREEPASLPSSTLLARPEAAGGRPPAAGDDSLGNAPCTP
jgi:hypothetical protein